MGTATTFAVLALGHNWLDNPIIHFNKYTRKKEELDDEFYEIKAMRYHGKEREKRLCVRAPSCNRIPFRRRPCDPLTRCPPRPHAWHRMNGHPTQPARALASPLLCLGRPSESPMRKWARNKKPEIMPKVNEYFSGHEPISRKEQRSLNAVPLKQLPSRHFEKIH